MHDRYHVVAGPPLSPHGTPVESLGQLAAALNALDAPVAQALGALTEDMVELAFNSVPPKDRQTILHLLGIRIAAPRRVSKSLCRDVLSRMRREAEGQGCTCPARGLTLRVLEDLERAVWPLPGQGDPADPVARWGSPLAAVALFSWCQASAVDARLLMWAAERDWPGVHEAAEKLETLRAAASHVVATAPQAPRTNQQRPLRHTRPRQSMASYTEQDQPRAAVEERLPDVPGEAGPPEVESTIGPAHPTAEVASLLGPARDAAGRVVTAVTDGRPPADPDLRELSALGPAFAQAQEALAAHGIADVPARLDDLNAAWSAYQEKRDRDRADRAPLLKLGTVECMPDGAAAPALRMAQGYARELVASPVWDEADHDRARALTALVGIIELHAEPGAHAQIEAGQEQLGQALPECAMAALLHKQLSFPHQRSGGDDGHTTSVAAPDAQDSTTGVPDSRPPDAFGGEDAKTELSGPATTSVEVRAPANPLPVTLAAPSSDISQDRKTSQQETTEPLTAPLPAPRVSELTFPEDAESTTGGGPDRTQRSPGDRSLEEALIRLVAEKRFGLATHISRTAERSRAETAALRLAAAVTVLQPGSRSAERAVGDALRQWDDLGAVDPEGTEFFLLPFLVRTALITGEHGAGAQLQNLTQRLPESLSQIASEVATRALNGALVMAPPMAVIADVSESETKLRAVTGQCRALLKPQRLRYNRATDIAKRWLSPEGMLGRMLLGIINGDRDAEECARNTIERLSRLSEIQSEINQLDRQLRGSSRRPLEGSGRQDLVHVVERVLDCAKEWVDTTEALRRGNAADNDWAVGEIARLRQIILAGRDGALAELRQAGARPDPLAAAMAGAAGHALEGLCAELEHGVTATAWPEPELDVRQLIDAELLKVTSVPGRTPTLDELLDAVDRTWDEALTLHEEGDSFESTSRILDLDGRALLPGTHRVVFDSARRGSLEASESLRRKELGEWHMALVAELQRAQFDGAVTVDQDITLQERLADARPTTEDGGQRELSAVRRTLGDVAELLPRYREEASDRLRARLDAVNHATEEERTKVLHSLDTGGFATAADLVYFLELGQQVPEIGKETSHLTDFFPSVPEGLVQGITPELIKTVRERGRHSEIDVLDYRDLSADEAERAAKALSQWRQLASKPVGERRSVSVKSTVTPWLSLLGFDAEKGSPLQKELPYTEEYWFADVTGVGINGRAWVPAFGSKLEDQGGRLRVMLLWGSPSAQLLLSRAAKEISGESLLVAYFGTLSPEARTELAAGSAGHAPLMVVDDAALAYLAARGNRQASVATETLLPFSGVNPYIKEKRGRIGREMFYGRDAERADIISPQGKQIIYGGRGLGKSALLHDAAERFAKQDFGYRLPVYLDLQAHSIGKSKTSAPERVWSILQSELTDKGVLEQRNASARNQDQGDKRDPHDVVRTGIGEWLQGDVRRRLLILLDECDAFFTADVPDCSQTRRLKELCDRSDGRVKVVFAGLHSVQRFTRLARNGPFSHLAQTPIVVGPLVPQFAADLLARPLRALGFEFDGVDLVNRVLGYCSYQPFLLQMFGSRLVEVMQRSRAQPKRQGPPYIIEAADVEAVESDPSLRADITGAFRDTLALDDRYAVIANVLAQHARESGLESRLSDTDLRYECEYYWKAGFGQLDTEGFRAYLQEMVGLGVLAPNHDGHGWHLRGPNALRMIGSAQEVEARLMSAETEYELEETVILADRPELPDRRSAPLTVAQMDDLLREQVNQTRVVLGSVATGVSDVAEALRTVAAQAEWETPTLHRVRDFRNELVGGDPGKRRVIVSDLAGQGVQEDNCRQSLRDAQELLPAEAGAKRAVVLIAGTGQLDLWRELLSDSDAEAAHVVVLRRYDARGLKSWSQRRGLFHTDDRLAELREVTGGWPGLVDRAVELAASSRNQDQALRKLRDELQRKDRSAEFVEGTGLASHPLLTLAYRAIAEEFDTAWADPGDVLAAVELAEGMPETDAPWVTGCLEALQVLERDGARLRMEPVLQACWSRSG
ncbi:hypothetical protein ACFVUW_12400 [Streptomyces xiamenensis]|uniref:hypothetical protein n=1 Tax=Streptomyces xiamenensis TaxID=408015 RepID=UPI0036E16FC2